MKEQERDSKQQIAFVQLFAEAAASAMPDEIQVVPTGKWSHPVYGEMEITPAHIAEFVQNFSRHVFPGRLYYARSRQRDNRRRAVHKVTLATLAELGAPERAGIPQNVGKASLPC